MLKLAIVGRPNVGKSTLFNRLVGKKLALVDAVPGVTRDVRIHQAQLLDLSFMLYDTAGLEHIPTTELQALMQTHLDHFLHEVDGLLFVFDARDGVTQEDEALSQKLRTLGKPIIAIANKCESDLAQRQVNEGYRLGFGEPIAISAEHNLGMQELFFALEHHFKSFFDAHIMAEEHTEKPIKLAIVGRPNVGKSTLINAFLNKEQQLTGPMSGLTRDTIEFPCTLNKRTYLLADTAGIRKSYNIHETLEKRTIDKSIKAIDFAEIVILVIDANQPLEKQDRTLADYILQQGRGFVLAVNKCDSLNDAAKKEMRDLLSYRQDTALAQIKNMPIHFISALNKTGLEDLIRSVEKTHTSWQKQLKTSQLNSWLKQVLDHHPPPLYKGKPTHIRFIAQVKTRPPAFALWVNYPQNLRESYLRYLSNELAKSFNFFGTPLRFILKKGKNPYT